jgi:hypothetical protein
MMQPQSRALYELQRANDHVLCAMKLLAHGKGAEAQAQLRKTLHWRHFATALMRPRLLINLSVGSLFLVSTYVGLGSFVGQEVCLAYARRDTWGQEPGPSKSLFWSFGGCNE